MRFVQAGIMVAVVLFMPFAANSHHSESGFDVESVIAFRGTVTQFRWRNPHVYITVETAGDGGEPVTWEVETGATPLLARSGWTPRSLIPGERIWVRGHPAREPGRRYALLLTLEKEDGTVLEQTLGGRRAPAEASDLSGVWKGLAALGFLAEGFDEMPLTEKGTAAQAAYDPNTENPAAMCIAYPSPAVLLATTFFLTEIDLGSDVVTFRNEWFDVERTVYMDGRGHPPNDAERTNVQGHSIGWWEGDTLVVDTTHFADHRSPYQTGVPSGAQKHVVERYTLNEERTGLAVEVFLEDPEYLAEPFRGSLEWSYRPDLELFSFNCDPEVSSHFVPR